MEDKVSITSVSEMRWGRSCRQEAINPLGIEPGQLGLVVPFAKMTIWSFVTSSGQAGINSHLIPERYLGE